MQPSSSRHARTLGGFVASLLLVSPGCVLGSSDWSLPDRDDPAVQDEEARLAQVIENSDAVWDDSGPMSCKVRLLGTDDDVRYVNADCRSSGAGFVSPLRVEGTRIIQPGDGNLYADSVRQMFPAGLAELVLDRDPAVTP
jgi:hypothetical protein